MIDIAKLKRSKTAWIALGALVGVVEEFCRGAITAHQAIAFAVVLVLAVCIRDALPPKARKAVDELEGAVAKRLGLPVDELEKVEGEAAAFGDAATPEEPPKEGG